ncbi:cell division protein FtsZ [Marinigracilibium pacificum]|uniref:Cell division protein FtsZ n=1 Tax=Marinigracilibium pacificum TaxID=2729599 RepID=A0A848J0K2_9BACT|nr:cell division protein FtsZ [Marinigracilibium pacificum]NMM50087.1 cell division protein FtsZ [Marinigracilibium pacificum]
MSDNGFTFDIPQHQKSIIKVIGVGGGGSNAVNHMYNQGIKDVEFVVVNTDSQALKASPVPNRLQIGTNLTEGLGAGANPEIGKNAAIESKEEIREFLGDGTKMVFVTAGMGGGTGTGAAPQIARIAKDMDILTVGIVTAPFGFEGKKKMAAAEAGIRDLKDCCDTVIVILNDKLREIFGNLAIREAFGRADNVLTTAAKGIAEIITVPGYVNVDFQDVNTVMKNSGAAVMGSAQTEGEGRALKAAEMAISSPLLNNRDIHGAQKILLSIISGEEAELQMDELTEITEYIQEVAGDDAEVIFGHGMDPDLGTALRVTLIATGFDAPSTIKENIEATNSKKVFDLESNRQIKLFGDDSSSKSSKKENLDNGPSHSHEFIARDEEKDIANNLFDLDDDFEVVDEEEVTNDVISSSSDNGEIKRTFVFSEIDLKKKKLQEQAYERKQKLSNYNNTPEKKDEDYKEKFKVPAYLRKKVDLKNPQHSSERNVSKYNLNDDNEILGNNKYLHDNVD